MGCCESASKNLDPKLLERKIKECIEHGSAKQLDYLLSMKAHKEKGNFNIDFTTIFNSQGDEVNILGYCLICRKVEMFKMLHEIYKASFVSMESYFNKYNENGLQIICEIGCSELLEYYMPKYILLEKSEPKVKYSRKNKETVELVDENQKKISVVQTENDKKLTPIQHAIINGHISIIKYVVTYSTKFTLIPELDIHYVNKATGYNCALLSCVTANYSMMKYLYISCKADFTILDNNKKNAIQILAIEASMKHLPEFYQCLVYLVEKVKIDINYNYEESIMLLNYVKAADYFLLQLAKLGIIVYVSDKERETLGKSQLIRQSSEYSKNEEFTSSDIYAKSEEINNSCKSMHINQLLVDSSP